MHPNLIWHLFFFYMGVLGLDHSAGAGPLRTHIGV